MGVDGRYGRYHFSRYVWKGLGWLGADAARALDLVVGGITSKPAVVNGRIELREILNLTVVFDHDVIDGAPATPFTRRLAELIESGYGLKEEYIEITNDAEPVTPTTVQVIA